MIWVPSAGGGPDAAFRYRESTRLLQEPELLQSYSEAIDRIEAYAANSSAPLDEWDGHAPALTVYAQWAVYALRNCGAIDDSETHRRLARVAKLQQRDGLGRGYPGIHRGRSAGWAAPAWWGGSIHAQHRDELIRRAPERYSLTDFTAETHRQRPGARKLAAR